MRKLWLALALVVAVGCGDSVNGEKKGSWYVSTHKGQPLDVNVVNNPDEARFKALEARVEQLEAWAVKVGGRAK